MSQSRSEDIDGWMDIWMDGRMSHSSSMDIGARDDKSVLLMGIAQNRHTPHLFYVSSVKWYVCMYVCMYVCVIVIVYVCIIIIVLLLVCIELHGQ